MSNQPQKPKQRRGFKVDGADDGKSAGYTRNKPRSLDEAFGIDRDEKGTVEVPAGAKRYDPKMVEAFLTGHITLGDLEGITKQEQYEMAKIGHSYLTTGRLDKAKTVFTGLLALDPFDAYFHTVLGSIAQQEGRLPEAEAHYGKALKINPFSATAYANRGEVRVQMGRLDEGAEDLINAIQKDPGGTEQATIRARSTLLVLKEQLAKAELVDLQRRASEATDSKVKAATKPGTTQPKVPLRAPPPAKPSAAKPSPKGPLPPKKK
jgi:tetratricopeptide (TPR) repeat protein